MKKQILLATTSENIEPILNDPRSKKFEFNVVHTGNACLEHIEKLTPDLIFLDILLPEIHGIEILKRLRKEGDLLKIPMIVISTYPVIQNYKTAIYTGATDFLPFPTTPDIFFQRVENALAGKLTPSPFHCSPMVYDETNNACYNPKLRMPDNYIAFWGTRGSIPVSGAEYMRFGGNTSCLEIRHGEDHIIIDAGSGIRALGETLHKEKKQKKYHLFIGHTHWDHITGFPFFEPIYDKDAEVNIYAPVGFEKSTKELFTDMLAYTYFPIRLDEMHAKMVFHHLTPGLATKIGDILIETTYTQHPGPTLAFKFTVNSQRIGYVTDNEVLFGFHDNPAKLSDDHPLIEMHRDFINFYKDCDLMIHEAQYLPQEYQAKVGWGHSSITNAAAILKRMDIKEWIVTHHDPSHTDKDLQEKLQLHKDIIEDLNCNFDVRLAHDMLVIPL